MSHHTYEATNKIQVNNYGIPEPFYENFASINDLQAILVPLLVVDKKGNRVGYGKGFYDELLAKISYLKIQKIGLCMSSLVDLIPYVEEHDVALDYCITPHKVYRFLNLDCLIIGAGPIGLTCAIEAKKAGISSLIIDRGALLIQFIVIRET